MSRVYITDYIVDPIVERNVLGNELSIESSEKIEVLLVWHQKVNSSFLEKFPNLKGIVRYGVGYDNVDISELKKRSVIFCNTPDYGINEVSDTALAMTLTLARGINEYNYLASFSRNGSWQDLRIDYAKRMNCTNVAVIGAGRIGSTYLKKMQLFTNNLGFYDPYLPEGFDKVFNAIRFRTILDLAKWADIISVHCPLTEETEGILDEKFFENFKGGILINTARGGLLKSTEILYDFLEERKLLAVGLDVLPSEPPADECPFIRKWKSGEYKGRVIVNPHTAFYSQESFIEMREKAALNAKNILENKPALNRIV